MNGIAGASAKQEKPAFKIMRQLLEKREKMGRK